MKKLSALLLTFFVYISSALPAFAAPIDINFCPDGVNNNFQNLCNISLSGGLFQWLITVAFIVATLLALAFLVFGGIRWILSGGDKTKVEEARNMIVAALIGLVITFLSYFILNIVLDFFGVTSGDGFFTLPSIPTSP